MRLAAEALGVLGVGEQARVQPLDRHGRPEHGVGRAPHRGHASAADQMVEPVAALRGSVRSRPFASRRRRHPARIPPRTGVAPDARGGWARLARVPAPQTVLIVEDDEAISDSIAYALDRGGLPHPPGRRRRPGPAPVPPAAPGPRDPRPDAAPDGRLARHRGAAPGGPARAGHRLQRPHQRVRPGPRPRDGRRRLRHQALLDEGAARARQRPPAPGGVAPPARRRPRRSRSRAWCIDPEQVQAFVDGRPVGFTPREFEVLYALARAEGKPVPRERVYREVWGYEMMPRRPLGGRLRAQGAPEAGGRPPGRELRRRPTTASATASSRPVPTSSSRRPAEAALRGGPGVGYPSRAS